MDRKSLAIGIAVGIAVVGCLAAIDEPEKDGEGRYQHLDTAEVTAFGHEIVILDTETGTLNIHDSDPTEGIEPTIVYPFVRD